MNSRVLNAIFGLIAVAALGFAGFMYFNRSGTTSTKTTPTPLATPTLVPSTTPSVEASILPTPNPNRSFSPSQPLSVPNEVTTLEEGGSLFTIASENGLSVDAIAKLNSIADPNIVISGQSIIVPDDVSGSTYTILFVTNKQRQTKDEEKVQAGGSSLYSDPVTAAQTDTKGIYGLGAETPYSKSTPTGAAETSATLSTSDDSKIITLTMEQTASKLWLIKKMTIKLTKEAGA